MSERANVIPDQGHWWFSTWKLDGHYCLTPFELSIASYGVTFIIRTGHRVFKWEYSRLMQKHKDEA